MEEEEEEEAIKKKAELQNVIDLADIGEKIGEELKLKISLMGVKVDSTICSG